MTRAAHCPTSTDALWTFRAAIDKLPRIESPDELTRCPCCGELCAQIVDLRVLPIELCAYRETACIPCCRRMAADGRISSVEWLTVLTRRAGSHVTTLNRRKAVTPAHVRGRSINPH